jgi:DNA-binding transcriptional LysR family regulator
MASSERLTLRGLRVFVALEEARSLAGAAESLAVSKSSVSQHISALERCAGVTLFDRKHKPVTLTPAGQILSLHAHRIIATVSEAEAALTEIDAGSPPVLNLAIIDDLDVSLTPMVATTLQARYSASFIRTFSGRSDQVTDRMISRKADIAVTASLPADINRFEVEEIFREHFVLIAAKDRYQQDKDWRNQLTKLPFVQYSEAMPIGQMVLTHLKRIRLNVERRYSFETTRSVIATVAKTGGWTLATPLSILDAHRFRDQIEVFPVPFAGLERSVYLINRIHELGSLPRTLTRSLRALLHQELLPELLRIAPEVAHALQVLDEYVDDDEDDNPDPSGLR